MGDVNWVYMNLGERQEKKGEGLSGPSSGTPVSQNCSLAKKLHLNSYNSAEI